MSYTYAAGYGDNVLPVGAHTVSVYLPGTTTLASLYTTASKGTAAANPVTTDALGNLVFYADPGAYDLFSGNTTVRVFLPADPRESPGGSTLALKSDVIVTTTGTGATDTTAIQAAVTASPGRTIRVVGVDTTLTGTITVQTDKTALVFDCGVTAGFTGGPMVRVLNAAYNKVITRFFDGNWQTGVIGIELMGALLGEFHLTGDRLPVGINLDCNNAAATQNSALNHLWLTVRNGIKGIVFLGKNGQFASNNIIERMDWWGAGSTVSTGLDFQGYCDNNETRRAYISLNFAGSIGVVYNSSSPSTDVQVYENHFEGIVESQITGTTAIKGNRTYQSIGQYPTYVRLRSSGANTPALSIAANCDLVHLHSNLNGVPAGAPGLNEIFIAAHEMKSIAGSPVEGNDWSAPIWTCQGGAISSLNFSKQIPPGWNTFTATLWFAPSSNAGGNTNWTIDIALLGVGYAINDGGLNTVTIAAGTNSNTIVSGDLATGQAVSGAKMMWAKVTRNGTATGVDTATTVDARVLGVMLTRTL